MKQANIDNIYSKILLLSKTERDRLYNRMKSDFYKNNEIVAYSANNQTLTVEQYKKRVKAGIEQCISGKNIDLETLTKELGYNYADLQSIVTYISEVESITRAKYIEQGILSEMKHLKYFPTAYPKDEYANMDNWEIRFVIKWHYKILFFIDANCCTYRRYFSYSTKPSKTC